eukprot:scaffold80311_cov25-Tisochrysis_lutea.AAC.1
MQPPHLVHRDAAVTKGIVHRYRLLHECWVALFSEGVGVQQAQVAAGMYMRCRMQNACESGPTIQGPDLDCCRHECCVCL